MANRIDYDVEYYQRRESSPAFQAEIKAIVDLLQPAPVDTFVELGCGSGILLSHIAQYKCRQTIGLDWLTTSVTISFNRVKNVHSVVSGDAATLPFPTNSIDKLAAQHLIEHFKNTKEILQEWRRVLRTGGKLALITPNKSFPHQHWFDDPTHQHIFTREELAKHVQAAGFRVDELRIINPYFFHWRFHGFAARHLQGLYRLPYIGTNGMSILLGATNVEKGY